MNNQAALWHIPFASPKEQERQPRLLLDLQTTLLNANNRFQNIALASSLAAEDMVLTDIIAKLQLPISVFVLNTGKLNSETLAYWQTAQQNYPQLTWQHHEPKESLLAAFESDHDFTDIYQDLSVRKKCCYVRKIEPLNRALQNTQAWLTGQRKAQSATRTQLPIEEWDEAHQNYKFNLLADWQDSDVWAYIQNHGIPINPLYHQGYPSIGCEPCTKPIRQGEDVRAGRWWWEDQNSKECGLHASNLNTSIQPITQ